MPITPNAADTVDVANAIEQERLRLAHDLHDDLGSLLVAAKMAMAPLLSEPQKNADELKTSARRADALIDQAIEAMQRVLHDLRPLELALGLVGALQQIADDYRLHALPCDFSSNQAEIDIAPDITLGLLRICREALTNVAKHAAASHVSIRLDQQNVQHAQSTQNASYLLTLDIIDDGHGYPAEAQTGASIERRVQALRGTLERLPAEHGCHLRICVPIPRPAAAGSS